LRKKNKKSKKSKKDCPKATPVVVPVPAAPLPSNIPAHALEIAAAVESCENEAAGIITHPGMPPMQVAAGVTPT